MPGERTSEEKGGGVFDWGAAGCHCVRGTGLTPSRFRRRIRSAAEHFLLGDPTAGSVKAGMEADSSDARDTPSSSVDTRQPWESERPKDRPVLSPDSLNSTDQSSGWVSLPRTYPGAW